MGPISRNEVLGRAMKYLPEETASTALGRLADAVDAALQATTEIVSERLLAIESRLAELDAELEAASK